MYYILHIFIKKILKMSFIHTDCEWKNITLKKKKKEEYRRLVKSE